MAKRRNENAISLFPFLAVLVCTMGALILLLLVTTRRIRQKQQEAPVPVVAAVVSDSVPLPTGDPPADEDSEPQPGISLAEWQEAEDALAQAQQQRRDAEQSLAEKQKQHARSVEALEQERAALGRLQADRDDARRRHDTAHASVAARTGRLDALKAEQTSLERRLQELQQQSEKSATELANAESLALAAEQLVSRRNSALTSLREFSRQQAETPRDTGTTETVIEFSNSSGTSRTPIMIDLTGDGFLFPASGVTVRRRDMDGVSATDNPLLSGVLATHRQRSLKSGGDRPYVLLLVRPKGTLDFYLAQRVFSAARIHYGYELVTGDAEVAAAEPVEGEVAAVREAVLSALMRRQKYYEATSALKQRIATLQEAQRGQRGPSAFRRPADRRVPQEPIESAGAPPNDEGWGPANAANESESVNEGTEQPSEWGRPHEPAGQPDPTQSPPSLAGGRSGHGMMEQQQQQQSQRRPQQNPWQSIPSIAEANSHVEQALEQALAARDRARRADSQARASESPLSDPQQTVLNESVTPPGERFSPSRERSSDEFRRRSYSEHPAQAGAEQPVPSSMNPGHPVQGQSGIQGESGSVADSRLSTQPPVRFPPLDGQTYHPQDTSPATAGTASGAGGQHSGQATSALSGLVSYEQITIYLDPQHFTVSGRDSVALHGQPISQITGSLVTQLYEISQESPHPLAQMTLPAAKFVVSPGAHTLYLQLAAELHDLNIPVSSVVSMDAFVPWPTDHLSSLAAPAGDVNRTKTDLISSGKGLP